MDLLKAMDSFVRVVNTGSFAAAAAQLGVSPGIITRNVQQLEEHLGARLINRTTRRLSVTGIGREYYAFCARTFQDIKETESAIAHLQREPSGTLKVLAPKSFGSLHMGGVVHDFMKAYPEIRTALTLADYSVPSVDLVENGFDVALRLTSQRDSRLVARRIGMTRWVLCAAPSYLWAHGAPQVPADVARHNCLVHTKFANAAWPFRDGRRSVSVRVSGTFTTNSVLLIREMARNGAGLALLPAYCIGDALQDGSLVRLLPDFPAASESIYVVYPHRKLLPTKVRLFIDFVAERFRHPPWEHDLD